MAVALLGTGGFALAAENGEADKAPASSTPPMSASAPGDHPAPNSTPPLAKPTVVVQLESLVDGLEMASETDAPMHVFWAHESPDEPKAADIARLSGIHIKTGDAAETRSLSDLLDGPAEEEEWMTDDDKKTARRFAALRAFLEANFAEIEVVAWGTTTKQIVIAGRVEGGYAGIVTVVVET